MTVTSVQSGRHASTARETGSTAGILVLVDQAGDADALARNLVLRRQLVDLSLRVIHVTASVNGADREVGARIDDVVARVRGDLSLRGKPLLFGGTGIGAARAAHAALRHDADGVLSVDGRVLSVSWGLHQKALTTLLLVTTNASMPARLDSMLSSRVIGASARRATASTSSVHRVDELRRFKQAALAGAWSGTSSRTTPHLAARAAAIVALSSGSAVLVARPVAAAHRHGDGITHVAAAPAATTPPRLLAATKVSAVHRLGDARLHAQSAGHSQALVDGKGVHWSVATNVGGQATTTSTTQTDTPVDSVTTTFTTTTGPAPGHVTFTEGTSVAHQTPNKHWHQGTTTTWTREPAGSGSYSVSHMHSTSSSTTTTSTTHVRGQGHWVQTGPAPTSQHAHTHQHQKMQAHTHTHVHHPAASGVLTNATFASNTTGNTTTGGTFVGKPVAAIGAQGHLQVTINGQSHDYRGLGPASVSGNTITTPTAAMGGLNVSRQISAPTDDHFVRVLNSLTNTTANPITATVRLDGTTPGNDSLQSSTGPTFTVRPDDHDGSRYRATLGFVLGGTGAATGSVAPSNVTMPSNSTSEGWTYQVTIAPGSTAIIANFYVVDGTGSKASTDVARVAALPPHALEGMSSQQIAEMVNFSAQTPGAPSAPSGIKVVARPHAAWLQWAPSTSPKGKGKVLNYTVTPHDETTSTSLSPVTCPHSNFCVVPGLTPGHTYTFTITATNGTGTSAASSASAPVTIAAPPSSASNVVATAGPGWTTVTWSRGASSPQGTRFTVRAVGDPSISCISTYTTCTFYGLANGQSYSFEVVADNTQGTASAATSNPVTAVATPPAPTRVRAEAGHNSATISWSPTVVRGVALATSYVVTAVGNPSLTCTTSDTMCTMSGLTPGSSYTFTVEAINPAGPSPASMPSNTITPNR